eukprot:13369072-Alexandrium_andersonii.AAC.1
MGQGRWPSSWARPAAPAACSPGRPLGQAARIGGSAAGGPPRVPSGLPLEGVESAGRLSRSTGRANNPPDVTT